MRWIKWLYPGMNIKRWLFLFSTGVIVCAIGTSLLFKYKFIHVVEKVLKNLLYFATDDNYGTLSILTGTILIVIGIVLMIVATRKSIQSVLSSLAPGQTSDLLDKMFFKSRLARGPCITVIGGGTGLSVLLRGMKQITNNCAAVVTSADDGGSSGRLRQELGIIPPGDFRDCLVALADTEPLMEKLMQYRFKGNNQLSGHNFGNLFIAAMSDIVGDMESGLKETSEILKVRGKVIPSTMEYVDLVAEMKDGRVIRGESNIPKACGIIDNIYMTPRYATATAGAIDAIANSDILIFGPGSLYTSVMPNLLVNEIKQTVLRSKAVKIYICNVMTQPGETDNFSATDHVKELIKYMDNKQFLDYVIVNSQLNIQSDILEKYALQGAYPVANDSKELENWGIKVISANLISQDNLIRHNPEKLARTVISLIYRLHLSASRFNIFEYYFIKRIMRNLKQTNPKERDD